MRTVLDSPVSDGIVWVVSGLLLPLCFTDRPTTPPEGSAVNHLLDAIYSLGGQVESSLFVRRHWLPPAVALERSLTACRTFPHTQISWRNVDVDVAENPLQPISSSLLSISCQLCVPQLLVGLLHCILPGHSEANHIVWGLV